MKFNLFVGCLRGLAVLFLAGVLPIVQNDFAYYGVLIISVVFLSVDTTTAQEKDAP